MARPRGPALNNELILDQIELVFRDLSLKDLTLSMISKELDIKSPSLYSHFINFNDVKDQLTARALIRMKEFLERAVTKNPKKDPLKSFIYAYREFAHQNPLLFDCAQFGIRSNNKELMNLAFAVVEIPLARLKARGIIGEKAIHKIRIIRSLLNGFINLEREEGFQRSEKLDKTFKELIKFTEKGLNV